MQINLMDRAEMAKNLIPLEVDHINLPQPKDRGEHLMEASPRSLSTEADLPLQVHELTRLAVTYLRLHFAAEQLSRCQIASYIAVSERHLTYIFRRDLGITPWKYLTNLRIEQAKTLLHVTNLTATEIAGRVGYNDGAYFCRVFHRETGCSPSAFRRQHRCRQDLHGLSQLVSASGKSLPIVQDSRAPALYYIAATQRTAVQLLGPYSATKARLLHI